MFGALVYYYQSEIQKITEKLEFLSKLQQKNEKQ